MMMDAINELKKGKKMFIFYPYCKGNKQNYSMKDFQSLLEKHTGKNLLAIIQKHRIKSKEN